MKPIGRRQFLQGGLSVASAGALAGVTPRRAGAAGKIVVTDPGGSTQAAYITAYYKPFEQETGNTVAYAARPNLAMGQLKSMVLANNVEWDLTYLTDYLVELAVKDDLLEKIDYSKMDPKLLAEMLPGTAVTYMAGGGMFGTVQAHSTKKWPVGEGPQNWIDFWDVKRFPGRRSMIGFAYGPMEQALLADGVARDKLYPLDVKRALAKLDEIRPHVTVWTSSSAQQHQLLVNQEVDLIQGFANRIYSAITDGAPAEIQFQDGSINHEGWVIPKGSKNRELALKFIEFSLDAKRQAASVTGSGPTNSRATQFLPEPLAKALPTYPENFAKMYRADAKWLADNQTELQARWTEWKAKRT
jgi:putative spermidine/putrescine transport system substrate-binding protein